MILQLLHGRRKLLVVLAFAKAVLLTTSCKTEKYSANQVSYEQVGIDSTFQAVDAIEAYVQPYKERLDAQMGAPLSYNPASMYKNDTPLNTRIGNLLAGIVREQSAPIIAARGGQEIDMVLLNHGGIRAGIDAGTVTTRTAYEVMPFDNEIVMAKLAPEQMKELVAYLIEKERAHPFDGLQIQLRDNADAIVTLNGEPLTYDRDYYVLTSDYLLTGGDNMTFFTQALETAKTDYKIRNAMIDYFTKTDTLGYSADDRFIKIQD